MLSNKSCATIEEIRVERLTKPETTYNFEVEDFHTYYVSESKVLVHNDCFRREFAKKRKEYWKEQGKKYENSINPEALSESGQYYLTEENVGNMLKGKAPVGTDNKLVNLHHVDGINADIDYFVEITRTEHYARFKELHPWLYKK